MNPRAMVVALALALATPAGDAAKGVPGVSTPPPGTPSLPKLPPPPDATLYYHQFPRCMECRTALAYMVESFEVHCRRQATNGDQSRIAGHPNFRAMVNFVQAAERNEARGKFSTFAPGDKRRALTLKAKFLIEEQACN